MDKQKFSQHLRKRMFEVDRQIKKRQESKEEEKVAAENPVVVLDDSNFIVDHVDPEERDS